MHNERDWILDLQADLQTGLGILRMEIAQVPKDGIQQINLTYSENRFRRALASCHMRLDELGVKMANPCTHSEIWDGPDVPDASPQG